MSVVKVSEVVDDFLAAHVDVRIDFVHGEQAVRDTVAKEGATALGLLLPPIAKGKFMSTLKQCGAKLKGSVGEGPNQTNYSDQSSVRILAKI